MNDNKIWFIDIVDNLTRQLGIDDDYHGYPGMYDNYQWYPGVDNHYYRSKWCFLYDWLSLICRYPM